MERIIYVRLLDEGTLVYRPVPAEQVGENIYVLKGEEIFNPDNETWEFLPGMKVLVIDRVLENKKELVAITKLESPI